MLLLAFPQPPAATYAPHPLQVEAVEIAERGEIYSPAADPRPLDRTTRPVLGDITPVRPRVRAPLQPLVSEDSTRPDGWQSTIRDTSITRPRHTDREQPAEQWLNSLNPREPEVRAPKSFKFMRKALATLHLSSSRSQSSSQSRSQPSASRIEGPQRLEPPAPAPDTSADDEASSSVRSHARSYHHSIVQVGDDPAAATGTKRARTRSPHRPLPDQSSKKARRGVQDADHTGPPKALAKIPQPNVVPGHRARTLSIEEVLKSAEPHHTFTAYDCPVPTASGAACTAVILGTIRGVASHLRTRHGIDFKDTETVLWCPLSGCAEEMHASKVAGHVARDHMHTTDLVCPYCRGLSAGKPALKAHLRECENYLEAE
ncbi:hypothetical protein B0H10DRAFT_2088062 [Mycena sp. CBHHK59/15]|nr:hypothetical protein B0H10DRAFT_2088062 [Mycena sp. CBHHK59/15]